MIVEISNVTTGRRDVWEADSPLVVGYDSSLESAHRIPDTEVIKSVHVFTGLNKLFIQTWEKSV